MSPPSLPKDLRGASGTKLAAQTPQINAFPYVFIDLLLIWEYVDKYRVGVCWCVDNYGGRRLFHRFEFFFSRKH